MNFFIGILLFLLIIYHTCILAPKKFVNLKVKEKKNNNTGTKVSNNERDIYKK